MKRRRIYSRKGQCPRCNVSTGSRHSKDCPFAFVPETNSKSVRKVEIEFTINPKQDIHVGVYGWKNKMKAIISIILYSGFWFEEPKKEEF